MDGLEEDLNPHPGWYAVRCVFKSNWPPPEPGDRSGNCYEERITLWRAASFDEAIAKAEAEAVDYAARIEESPGQYLELAQAYELFDDPADGSEVFSQHRTSALEPSDYLDNFFDTGDEHQQHLDDA